MSESEAYLFTSESVTEGHPDKVADQISDAVLDAVLEQDPKGRVACETLVNTGLVLIAGELTTTADLDFSGIARRTLRDIGYTDPSHGFDCANCAVLSAVDSQPQVVFPQTQSVSSPELPDNGADRDGSLTRRR